MVKDIYATVRYCQSYAHNRTHRKEPKEIQAVFPERQLEYVGMHKLGLCQRKKPGNYFVVVMTERFTKTN